MVDTILGIAFGLMLISLVMAVYRFVAGPRTTDRIVSFDVMTIISLSVVGMLAYFADRIIYLDVAIVYGLLSFLGVIIIARYLEKGL